MKAFQTLAKLAIFAGIDLRKTGQKTSIKLQGGGSLHLERGIFTISFSRTNERKTPVFDAVFYIPQDLEEPKLVSYFSESKYDTDLITIYRNSFNSAEGISLCADHQKRVEIADIEILCEYSSWFKMGLADWLEEKAEEGRSETYGRWALIRKDIWEDERPDVEGITEEQKQSLLPKTPPPRPYQSSKDYFHMTQLANREI